MPSLGNVLFRVDSSRTIGTGHFVRSFALAQCLSFFGSAPTFIMANCLPEHRRLLENEGFPCLLIDSQPGTNEDSEATVALVAELDASWIVLDGYSFSETYQKRMKEGIARVVLFDDYYGSNGYPVDVIINNNLYANAMPYHEARTQADLLVGTKYSILRPRFLNFQRKEAQLENPARNILVIMGGTDTLGRTSWALDEILHSRLDLDNVTIIAGNGSANKEWTERITNAGTESIRVLQATEQMPELMEWADLVITAGGTTTHELLYVGTPFITIIVAENQRMSGLELEKRGISLVIDGLKETKPMELATAVESIGGSARRMNEMMRNGAGLVDGFGANRVASKLMGTELWYRRATKVDMTVIWNWANDPVTKKWSFNTALIPWEDHTKWFAEKMQDRDSLMLMAFSDEDEPIGLVRVDKNEDVGRMSINIGPSYRGRGYGAEIIGVGCRAGASSLRLNRFEAYIKLGNSASLKAFQRAGFKETGMEPIEGYQCHHLAVGV